MRAARIHRFGPPDVIDLDDLPLPTPGAGQVLVRVAAAGVGPWDALIREKKSVIDIPLPLTLGSDISGIVVSAGSDVPRFKPGDAIYGATNPQFVGGCAEYALASAEMIAAKPTALSFPQAAGVPIVAVTAWQMLFDYAQCEAGQSVLIHGAAGSVGLFAVQLARQAGLRIFATASARDAAIVKTLGADTVLDYKTERFEEIVGEVDIVLDMIGGEVRNRSFQVIRPGGILVSVVSNAAPGSDTRQDVRSVFFLVDVTTQRLEELRAMFDDGRLQARVATLLALDQVRLAHEMLAGASHKSGKIVLNIADV